MLLDEPLVDLGLYAEASAALETAFEGFDGDDEPNAAHWTRAGRPIAVR